MEFCYLENSGFLLRHGRDWLLIDCIKKPPEKIMAVLDKGGQGAALVSHFHGDHFNPWIFELKERWPGIQYLLSSDIRLHHSGSIPPEASVRYLEKGQSQVVNEIQVTAWGSTDEGISFQFNWGDRAIFHAGDLNCWHWKDESTQEAAQEAMDWFERELEEIARGVPPLDAAFFPVDPRMGTDYYRGAVRFAQVLRPKVFVPMHFGPRLNPPQTFYEEMRPLTQVVQTQQGWSPFPW
jgi:L-ascorbate metabolism protein UlaG (beta-lactamase superfamily)